MQFSLNLNQRERVAKILGEFISLLLDNRVYAFSKFKKARLNVVAILVLLLAMPAIAQATTINYTASSLGGSVWQYDYMIENDTLTDPIAEFTIYFPETLYENLVVSSSPLEWDSIVVQPDTGLPADGFFDALSLSTGLAPGASAGLFSVTFNFLGTSSPADQFFDVYDANFNLLDSGTTSPLSPVPELNSFAMLILGLFLVIGYSFRRNTLRC